MGRAPALVGLLVALALYDAFSADLPSIGTWPTVAFISLVLIPATLLVAWLGLPIREALEPPYLLALALVAVAVTIVLEILSANAISNQTKLVAVVLVGWWFLIFFEHVGLVLIVALLIVPVDIFSVARGPTKHIVEKQPEVFNALSIAFPVPGEHTSAQLGLPDILFFSLFLAASVRFGLRPRLTWTLTALSFGATLALTVWTDVSGLPALPFLSAGFLLANGDLLWQEIRRRRRPS
ncbi:MAG TPA: hypothetical protein VH306_11195 [Gaiellaceae bacterium]